MAVVKREGVYKDLMEIGWFKRLMKRRGLQFSLQIAGLTAFGVIVYAGLFGTPVGGENVGSTFTWLIWWTIIPVTMLVVARGWCLVCPWIALGEWLQRLAFWQKGKRTLSLNLKVPRLLQNFGLMLVFFLILHWADSSFHLALRPETTVYLALSMFALAIFISLTFEKRSFCRYFCPIGAIIAPYSLAAPIELRNKDPEVCRRCKTRDCLKGNEKGYGCPMMTHPYDFNIDQRGYAPCRVACPAGVNSDGYIALISKGKFKEALELHKQTMPFAGVCGRVCTHPCETHCERAKVDEPVSIRGLKRFMADYGLNLNGEKPTPIERTKEGKVAVIGSGPAGLACAYDLVRQGYPVTVFEAASKAGGLLRYGIPEYRLPKEILDKDIKYIEELGVEIKTNTQVKNLRDIFNQGYKAIFLGSGAGASQKIGIPDEDTGGVIHALDFLKRMNSGEKVELGNRVGVIGGGNAAVDAARVARRMGAREVSIIYRRSRDEMPAIRSEIEEAEREGVKINFLAAPVKVLTKNNRLSGIQCIRMELGEPDADGRRQPIPIESSEFNMELDNVIIAIGQQVNGAMVARELEHTDWGTISADPLTRQTNTEGVFAGGDVVAGPADAIGAIADGKEAAISIERYLSGVDLREGRSPIRRTEELSPEPLEIKPRGVMPVLELAKRGSFNEVERGFERKTAINEARRCWNCGTGSNGIDRNTYCTLCTECIKTCPNDNISINIRKPFHDIFKKGVGFFRTRDIRLSLSVIAIVLLGIIPFHNLEMTALYTSLEGNLADGLGISQMIIRTVSFLMMGVITVAIFLGFSSLARWRAGDSQFNTKHIFIWFALTFIPLAISLHIAHNYFHLLEEGAVIIPTLSDPFGFGWNLFGTAGANVTILPSNLISIFQFLTVGLGFLASGYALYRLSSNMFRERAQALRAIVPMVVLLIGLTIFYMWVLTIPMTMRF